MYFNQLQDKLFKSLQVLHKYDWLLDAYVLDFYVDDHWSKLPPAWRMCLDGKSPQDLSELLEHEKAPKTKQLWPLELLALKELLHYLCINRKCHQIPALPYSIILEHPKLKQLFRKGVKAKKRHEIERMAAICMESYESTKVDFVVDFGAGLGHLARVLGYGYGVPVCCLEMQEQLNQQARQLDVKLEMLITKQLKTKFSRPEHVNLCLNVDMTAEQFLNSLRQHMKLSSTKFRFGIIGLHPCGDLGVMLMRMFLNCKQAVFINFVGCCHMKLSGYGYPLSTSLQSQGRHSQMSWVSREISCHANEMYYDRLWLGDYEYLKVHAFRAATESILRQYWPHLKHCGIKSVKHTSDMLFESYFYKAVQDMKEASQLDIEAISQPCTVRDLHQWKRIVIFYTLRLMLAPLVETIILYDRKLFLEENDCDVSINAIFNPKISPRNHITSAVKFS